MAPSGGPDQPVWIRGSDVSLGGGGGGGAVTVADGANVTQGATTDAAITTNAPGTLSGKLRGLVAILADVWDSANHRVKVDGSGVTQPVGGAIVRVTGTFTRPADTTAYAANDVVSNSTSSSTLITLSSALRANAGTGYIVGCRVATNLKSITPRIRVHVFNASAPTVSADNAAYQAKYADISKRVGTFDLAAMATGADTTNSDMSAATDFTLRIPVKAAAADTALYVLLETLDAFTPANGQAFTVELLIDQN